VQLFYQPLYILSPCSTPENVSATNITDHNARIYWDAVPGADSYRVQYTPVSAFSNGWVGVTATSHSKKLKMLFSSTQYYYRVRSLCGEEMSD
jgi:hypothetical protein